MTTTTSLPTVPNTSSKGTMPPEGRAALRAGVVGNWIDNIHVFLPLTALAPAMVVLAGPSASASVGALVVMLAIVPWTKIDGTASPFVQIFDLVGIPGAAAILNLVVLTAAMSAYNSGLYANGRMLHALAHQGDAPKVLGKVNRAGSPWVGVLVSSAVTAIAVVVVGLLPEQAFMYIMSIATISAIINWATIIITQMLFRRRLAPETRANIKFQMPGAPVTNWIVIAFLVLMVVVMLIMPPFRIAVAIGPIWLAVLTLGWWLSRRRNQSRG